MGIIFKDTLQIANEVRADWESAGLINTDEASILGTFLFPIQNKVSELYSSIYTAHLAHRISSAQGTDLDEIAYAYGVQRKTAEPASDYTYSNFRLYLPNGTTAKDYTVGGVGFSISANQYVSDGVASFITLDAAIFDADSHSAYVRIQGMSSAVTYVPEGSITIHNINISLISDIDTTKTFTLSCKNDKPIDLISILEDDTSLRDRLYNRVKSNGTNEDAIIYELKTIGIANADFIPDAFGVGTVGIKLVTGEPIISESTINAANAIIRAITPYARVIEPEYIVVKLTLRIEVTNESKLAITKSSIITDLKKYIDELPQGSTLDIIKINDTIDAVDNMVRHTIKYLYLNERKSIISSQRAASDQKFILSREDDAVVFVS